MIVRVLVFSLLLVGAAFIFDLNPIRAMSLETIKAAGQRLLAELKNGRRKTLRQQTEQAQGRGKENFFERNLSDARRVLISTNQSGRIKLMNRLCVVGFCIGFAAALLVQNILLLPVLSVGFALIPMWYIRFSEFHYKKQLQNELEVALSVITSSYLRTDNIVASVEENIAYMNEPVRSSFSKFVNEVRYVDANIQNGIQNLKNAIENPVFSDWCDILTLCVTDRTYKQSLPPVVEQFSDNKSLQNSLETIIQQPVKEFRGIIVIVLGTIPLLQAINTDWFFTLVGTWGGKSILAVLSVLLFAGMNKAIGLSAPIE